MSASIFDDVLAATSGNTEAEGAPEAEATEAPAEATETNAESAKTVMTLEPGQTPEGAVLVAEFAKIVNENAVKSEIERLIGEGNGPVEAAMEALNAQVSQATFYQAVKAQRNPLPHIEVRYNVPVLDENGQDTGQTKVETKVFIPVEAGLEFWKNRPTRGAGGPARSEEDVTKRLVKAGKKIADLKAAQERYEKLGENIKRMQGQVDKYEEWLTADGKTLADATEAYEAEQEKAEAEKAIGDNE